MLFSFQRDIAARQVEARYRDEFVQDLITRNIRYREELLNRGRQFGWDLSGSVRCVIFDIDEYKRRFGQPMSKRETRELEESRQRIYAAKERVAQLKLSYNKARQESITTELIEIISGVESMK